jgi:hypothetical protein
MPRLGMKLSQAYAYDEGALATPDHHEQHEQGRRTANYFKPPYAIPKKHSAPQGADYLKFLL